jgi:hypothetical protein
VAQRRKPSPAKKAQGARPAAKARPAPPLAWLPLAGLAVAVWASLPKYSGPTLNTEAAKEVADHVIPAVVVALVCLVALYVTRRSARPGPTLFVCGATVLLAGLWMMATHLPLVAQAARGDAPWPATIYHTSAALAVFGLGLLWGATYWAEAGGEAEPAAQAQK